MESLTTWTYVVVGEEGGEEWVGGGYVLTMAEDGVCE